MEKRLLKRILKKIDKFFHPRKYGSYETIKGLSKLKKKDIIYSLLIPKIHNDLINAFWIKASLMEQVEIKKCVILDICKGKYALNISIKSEDNKRCNFFSLIRGRNIFSPTRVILEIPRTNDKIIQFKDEYGRNDYVLYFSTDKRLLLNKLDSFKDALKKEIKKEMSKDSYNYSAKFTKKFKTACANVKMQLDVI